MTGKSRQNSKDSQNAVFFENSLILSTLFGEGLDALVFLFIGFFATMPLEALLLIIVAQALFKTICKIIIYPIMRTLIFKVRKLPEI